MHGKLDPLKKKKDLCQFVEIDMSFNCKLSFPAFGTFLTRFECDAHATGELSSRKLILFGVSRVSRVSPVS